MPRMPTVLAPPVAGLAEAQQSDRADCGTLAGNAVVQLFASAASLPVLDNATAARVAGAINELGIAGVVAVDEYPDDLNGYLAEHVPHGDYVMAGIRVNSWNCEPNVGGGAEHWVTIYSDDGRFYNCWFATYEGPIDLQPAYLASRAFVGCVRISHEMAPSIRKPQPKRLEELIAMLEPFCAHTNQGSYFINERGDYGIPGMPSGESGGMFPVVTTDTDGYNAICRARAAAWQEYLAALRGQPAPAGLTPVRQVEGELPPGMGREHVTAEGDGEL